MRKSCWYCCFKHVSAARILAAEIKNGYNNIEHLSLLCGHLANAEEHAIFSYPDLAEAIRKQRKNFIENDLDIDFDILFDLLEKIAKKS